MNVVKIGRARRLWPWIAIAIGSLMFVPVGVSQDETAEMERAALVIGPEGGENSCNNCHASEAEAWIQTRHYATYKDRHRSEEAKAILASLGLRSMKNDASCRQCHYTSQVSAEKVRPRWGVSCESCHGPGLEWNDIHNAAGDQIMKWGDGKSESAEARAARLGAAQAKGMIHSNMIYEIATNCFSCHTVPSEKLVNTGGHKAGSDFDLVAWSQGEIRHNFVGSDGAPDNPTNRESTPAEKQRLYVVGAMVDLEVSLRNLAGVQEKGGAYHEAMVARTNAARKKLAAIAGAVDLTEVKTAVSAVPATVDATTAIGVDLADKVGEAAKSFVSNSYDLGAINGLLPTEVVGEALP